MNRGSRSSDWLTTPRPTPRASTSMTPAQRAWRACTATWLHSLWLRLAHDQFRRQFGIHRQRIKGGREPRGGARRGDLLGGTIEDGLTDGVQQISQMQPPSRYGLLRLTPQPPGNVRWRSARGPHRLTCLHPRDKGDSCRVVLLDQRRRSHVFSASRVPAAHSGVHLSDILGVLEGLSRGSHRQPQTSGAGASAISVRASQLNTDRFKASPCMRVPR